MRTSEVSEILKTLQSQRAHAHDELAKLDKAIAVLRQLSDGSFAVPGLKKRTLSAAARRKIAKAQKARWAKVKQQKAAKA